MFKRLGISLLYFFSIIFIGNIFVTLFSYFNIFNNNIISILKLLIAILGMFISSYILGRASEKKGYIEGIKLGGIVIFIFIVITLLLKEFSIRGLVYYLILLSTSVFGSMLGISMKKN